MAHSLSDSQTLSLDLWYKDQVFGLINPSPCIHPVTFTKPLLLRVARFATPTQHTPHGSPASPASVASIDPVLRVPRSTATPKATPIAIRLEAMSSSNQ